MVFKNRTVVGEKLNHAVHLFIYFGTCGTVLINCTEPMQSNGNIELILLT